MAEVPSYDTSPHPNPIPSETSMNRSSSDGKAWLGKFRIPAWIPVVAVLVLAFTAYGRTLSFEFVSDDIPVIIQNRRIHSWHYLPQYFSENLWAGAQDPGSVGNYYRPLFLIWLRLNDAVFGAHPFGWHLTTVLMHLLATFLVYLLVLYLAEDFWTAIFAALVFGVHPAHIESVAWVNGVSESLLAVLLLGSFLLFLRERRDPGRGRLWFALSLTLFGMALLAKETAMIFPALVAFYEWTRLSVSGDISGGGQWLRRGLKALRSTAAYFLLLVPYLAVRFLVLKAFSHPSSLPVVSEILTWPSLVWFYIHHLVAPVGIASTYDLAYVHSPTVLNFWLPLLGSVLVIGALAAWARKSALRIFACVWMALFLLPVFDLRALANLDYAHDRFLYLPSIGFAILVALGLRQVANVGGSGTARSWRQLTAVGILGIGLAGYTAYQSFYFANNWVFYRYNYLFAPHNPYAAVSYGAILLQHGRHDESIKVLEEVTRENPNSWMGFYNLGLDYLLLGRRDKAEQNFQKAAKIQPDTPEKNIYLGWAYLDLGKTNTAVRSFKTAIRMWPSGEGYHYALGVALETQGDLREALSEFRTELANDPGRPELRARIALIEKRLSPTGRQKSEQQEKPN